jgi:hypothetical protein
MGRKMTSPQPNLRFAPPLLVLALFCAPAVCQELAPRAYWPGPKGTKVASLTYYFTSGDIVADPSLSTGVDSDTHSASVSYFQIFGLAGRTAGLSLGLSAVATSITAQLESGAINESLSGLSDLQFRFNINLVGAPAMTPQEFQAFRKDPPRGILGASLKIQLPTGEYNNDRTANIGTSRWAAKPELGYIYRIGSQGRWAAELTLGAWIYGENTSFVGKTRQQDPMASGEIHLVRSFSSGPWFSLDWNYYEGGRTEVDGERNDDWQQNSRLGATLAFPVERHVWRVALSDSLTVKKGGDYLGVLVGYSYLWN